MGNRSVKTFKSNSEKNKEPIPFEINGTTFEAKPSVNGLVLMELVRDTGEGGSVGMGAILRYLQKAMKKDEYARFEEFVEENDIDIVVINEIISYLIEEQSDRPTKPREA